MPRKIISIIVKKKKQPPRKGRITHTYEYKARDYETEGISLVSEVARGFYPISAVNTCRNN